MYQLNGGNDERLSIAYDSLQYLRLGPFTDSTTIAFEDAVWGWLRLLAYQVEQGNKSPQELESLSRGFGLPVRLYPPEEIPSAALDRIRTGRDVAFYSDQGTYYATTKLAQSDEYLRVGPLPEFQDVAKPASQTTLTSAFLASGLLTGLMVYSFSSKFRRIENVARSIARGNLSARVDESKAGETRELAKALNLMASKTESMIQSKHELLQMLSHELRTPLSRLRFAVDLLQAKPDDPKRTRRFEIINQSINELDLLVAEILDYIKNKECTPTRSQEWIDVRKAVEPIFKAIHEETPGLAVDCVSGSPGQTPLIYSDRIAFLRVAKNIVGNAQRYAKSQIVIRVLATQEESPSKNSGTQNFGKSYTCVEFEDDGPGIPEDKWLEVIEPFVRLPSTGPAASEPSPIPGARNRILYKNHTGIGLGLAIVNRILKQHGGRIEIGRGTLGGCLVRTYWPNPTSQPPMI